MGVKCNNCMDTGEKDFLGFLNCSEPGCDAAKKRQKMNEYIKSLGLMTSYDRNWVIFKYAFEMAKAEIRLDNNKGI